MPWWRVCRRDHDFRRNRTRCAKIYSSLSRRGPSYVAVRIPLTTRRSRNLCAPAPGRASALASWSWPRGAAGATTATTATTTAFADSWSCRRTAAAWPSATRTSGTADVRGEELPLIVSSRALVEPNGVLGALAPHADNATGTLLTNRGRLGSTALTGGPPATGLRLLPGVHRNEILTGDRVLPLLAHEALLHQQVERRGRRARARSALVLLQAAHPLLTAKDQLGLLIALRLVPPHGQSHAHQDAHHRDGNEHCSHGITALTVLTL
jgi:hypothetical protein